MAPVAVDIAEKEKKNNFLKQLNLPASFKTQSLFDGRCGTQICIPKKRNAKIALAVTVVKLNVLSTVGLA